MSQATRQHGVHIKGLSSSQSAVTNAALSPLSIQVVPDNAMQHLKQRRVQ